MSCERCLFKYGNSVCLRRSLESPCAYFVCRAEVDAYLRGEEPKGAGKDADEGEEGGRTLPQDKKTFVDKGKHHKSRIFVNNGGEL